MNEKLYNQLTKRLRQSDKEAFDRIFRLLYPSLVRFSYKYTKDKDASCDVVQDVFIKLWQVRDNLNDDKSIVSYLFQMVRNRSLNYLRKRSFEVSGIEHIEQQYNDINHSDSTETNSQNDKIDLLKIWIQKLPARQRDVIEMSRFEGLDHVEIATILDVSPRTVNNHIVAAIKNIRQFHKEHHSVNI